MSYFKAKMHQIRFRLGLCPGPLGELTALPQTPWLDLRGPTSKGRGGRGGQEREEQGRAGGGGRKGERQGGNGKGGVRSMPGNFSQILAPVVW